MIETYFPPCYSCIITVCKCHFFFNYPSYIYMRTIKNNPTLQLNYKRIAHGCPINFIAVMCYKMQSAEKGVVICFKYVN